LFSLYVVYLSHVYYIKDDIFEIVIIDSDLENEDDLDDLLFMHLHNENNIVIKKELYGSPISWGLHMGLAHTLCLLNVNLKRNLKSDCSKF